MATPPNDLVDISSEPPADLITPPDDLINVQRPSTMATIGKTFNTLTQVAPILPGNVAIGLLEQPAAGLGWFTAMGAATVGSALDMALAKVSGGKYGNSTRPGLSTGERFIEETNAIYSKLSDTIPFEPETPMGKAIMHTMVDRIITPAIEFAGDAGYFTSRFQLNTISKIAGRDVPYANEINAASGALYKAGATLAVLPFGKKALGVVSDAAKPIPKTGDFATDFPDTARRVEATSIGNLRFQKAVTEKPNQSLVKTVEDSIDKDLGITSDSPSMTLGTKVQILIQREAAKTGEVISPNEQVKIANTLVDKLIKLQQQYDMARAAGAPKGLPAPNATGGVVTVNSKGLAVTEQQWGDYYKKFQSMTPEQRAVELHQGPMGFLKGSLETYASARDSGNASVARKSLNALKRDWASIFSNPYDTRVRSAAMEEYINRAGDMTYEELLAAIPRKLGKKQSGILSLDGLEKNMDSLKHLGDGVSKYAMAGLVKPPTNLTIEDGQAKLYRGIAAGQSADITPGMWVTNSKDIATNVYAKGKDGAPDGTVTDISLPARDIVEVHPGGYIYAPKGTNLGGIVRYTDMTGKAILKDGVPITFDAILAKRAELKNFDKKQAGILDLSGIKENIPKAEEALKETAKKTWLINDDNAATAVKGIVEKNFKAMNAGQESFIKRMGVRARREVYAHDYDLQQVLRASGEYGLNALRTMAIRGGATMNAELSIKAMDKEIFSKFNASERKALDELTFLRRVIQIDKYKGVGTVRHVGGITGPMAMARREQMKQELGADTYNRINKGADDIFEQQILLLDKLEANGLETPELIATLRNFDYQRREFLDIIDPMIPIKSNIRGIVDIRSSGIKELGHGKTDVAMNMDAQALISEDAIRVENRIARNNALLAFRELAEKNPGNDFVRLPSKESIKVDLKGNQKMRHTPQGWTSLGVRVGGKQEFILMRDAMAEQFISRPEAIPEQIAVGLRLISGSSLMKASATTYNPGFILAGIPMDILHTWMADTTVYSPHLPVFMLQMGRNMAATAKDAITHKGAWEDAMREGIGNSYMTHEGRAILDPNLAAKAELSRHFKKTRAALSYLNETADMWLRLAYRDRLIESGLASKAATAEARMRLDYAQGGRVGKAGDTVVPYTNVTIQGTGKIIEAYNRDPGRMRIKLAWIVATSASVTLANMIASSETNKAISTRDKVRNYNITFGDSFFIIDADGNKRYAYVPIRLDQTIMPFNAAVVGALEKSEYGRVPNDLAGNAIGQIAPINSPLPIPTIEAISTYISNYDSFTERSIYTGGKVLPKDEVRTFGTGRATSPIAIGVGQGVAEVQSAVTDDANAPGLSPMRLEAAGKKLLNTDNTYIQMAGGMYKHLFAGADPREQANNTMLLIQNTPMLSNVIKFTSPGTEAMNKMQIADEASGSKYAPLKSGLDDLLFQFNQKQNGVTSKTIETYINNQPQEYRQQLSDHFKYGVTVDKVLKHYEASDRIPPRSWWIYSAKLSPEVRGHVFYNEWISAKPADRMRMQGIAQSLTNNSIGYKTDAFDRAFMEDIKLLGTEER